MYNKLFSATLLVIALFAASCGSAGKLAQRTAPEKRQLVIPPDAHPYVQKYAPIAVAEMERTGIPASIKLGQGILESNFGQSTLAREAFNHFGIKCGSKWTGPTYQLKDDDPGLSCFRKYDQAEKSYYDHSDFLTDPAKSQRYGFLFQLDKKDYKAWARGLKSAGYATSPTYAENLIGVVERHKLYLFDEMASTGGPTPTTPTTPSNPSNPPNIPAEAGSSRVRYYGESARYVVAKGGQTPYAIATALNLRPSRLAQYNECDEQRVLKDGDRIWLTPKRNRHAGKERLHHATAGQTLYEVAQLYGVRLAPLAKRNALPLDATLANGQQLKLK